MPELTVRASFRFMVRPRWHDALIVSAIVALLGLGVWALWWEDVRDLLGLDPAEEVFPKPPAPANPQT
jgi:uncharacterized membrane protein